MICPICENESAPDATECAVCGKALLPEIPLDLEVEPLDGYEPTPVGGNDLDAAFALDALDTEGVEQLEGLERTPLFDPRAEVPLEPLELDGVLPDAPLAKSIWTDELPELEADREVDIAPKTPEPDERGPCPWCAFPGEGIICNNCGRRRKRYTNTPLSDAGPGTSPDQTMLCPACFTRVLIDARCAECMAPLPRPELL